MARIQWQPLAIPDIGSTAIAAQAASGRAIQEAIQGLGGVLGQWEGGRRDANMVELIARQNAFAGQDPAAYDAALRSGQLTQGLTYLRPEQVAAARSYGNDLRQTRNADTSFMREGVRFDREVRNDTRTEAERVQANTIAQTLAGPRAALSAGRISQAQFDEEAQKVMPGATAAQIESIFSGRDAGIASYRGGERFTREIRNSDASFAQDTTRFNWETESRENQQAALALAQRYVNYNGTNEDLMADEEYLRAPAAVQALALQQLGRAAPPPPAAAPGGGGESVGSDFVAAAPSGGFAGGAPDASRVMNYEARNAGFAVVPPSVRTLGDASTFARQVNRGGAGSSAMGIYQITGDTLRDFGPRVFGSGWQSVDYGPDAEDKIGEAIFNASRGSARALRGRWVSLSLSEAERIRNLPWQQARAVIAAGESGAQISSGTARSQGTDLTVAASINGATDRYRPGARQIAEALNSDAPQIEVARSLTTAETGPFRGMDENRMNRLLRDVQDRYARANPGAQLPAAAAAQILTRSAEAFDPMKDFWGMATGRRSGVGNAGGLTQGATHSINWATVDDQLGRLRPDAQGNIPLATDVRNEQTRQGIIAGSSQGVAQLAAAEAELAAALERPINVREPNNPVITRLRQRVAGLRRQWGSFAGEGEAALGR